MWYFTLSILGLLASIFISSANAVLLPSDDPFYTPPSGYKAKSPGTVLRSRVVDVAFLSFIPEATEAYQLLYRTTAINGSAIAGVTTIFRPPNAKTDRFVSFQTAYDSSATECDPSYSYQLGSEVTDLITSFEQLLLQAYILSGYIVSSPDYEGPDAAFAAGHLEGMGVLDSMRAVNNFHSTLALSTANPKIVGYGYSGGAIATGWAASLQPSYAPNLNIAGWASGGTPSNLTGTTVFLDNTVFSGFLPDAFVGLSKPSAYGASLNPVIAKYATSEARQHLTFASENCAARDILDFPLQSVLSTSFNTLGPKLLYQPTVAYVLDQNIMGLYANETPTHPVYMYHATSDEIIPYSNAMTTFHAWCNDGASVKFVTVASGGHLTTEIIGFIGAFKFVGNAFAGTVATSGCSTSTIANTTIDPLALGLELEPILVELIDVLGTLGKGDSNLVKNISILQTPVGA